MSATRHPVVRNIAHVESREVFPGIIHRMIHDEPGLIVKTFEMDVEFSTEPHEHPETQITVMTSGEFHMEVAGEAIHLTTGTIVTIPGGLPHRAWSTGTPARGFDVFFLEPQSR